jgi:epoxyqueuosine reductase
MQFEDDFLANLGVVDYAYTEESRAINFDKYQEWIDKKLHGPLKYLEGERGDKREDLKLFWSEFESAIVFLFSYKNTKKILEEQKGRKLNIASYALGFDGQDYHHVLKERLASLAQEILQKNPAIKFQISLDVHPVLERDLALRSGLGWIGKNSMLINRAEGSYFIIASLLLNQKLPMPKRMMETDHCGQCTRCIDACPTSAIDISTRTIRANDCISTFTIEQMKLDSVASEKMNLDSGNIFGCDICQDVCPWNKKLLRKLLPEKYLHTFTEMQDTLLKYFCIRSPLEIINELETISDRQFRRKFIRTSFERGGKSGILKNLLFYIQNKL